MNRTFRSAFIACAMLFAFITAQGQSFDYTFSDTNGTYQELTGATVLAANTNWHPYRFKIPIGFSFPFAGSSFDSLALEPYGFVKFGSEWAIIAYHGMFCKLDTNNVYSQLLYKLQGSVGNRILKIQYVNCGYERSDPDELVNYQVWLYETGVVEIHTGPTTYPGVMDSLNPSPYPLMGLINPLQTWPVSSLLITGDPNSPVSQPVNGGSSLVYMDFVPPPNKVYSFTPF